MRISKGVTLVATTFVLALAVQGSAATTPTVYTVGSTTVPGVDTGLLLESGRGVTVTSTGVVCLIGSFCEDPDGDPSYDTSQGGFLLPGAPVAGLVGRVGNGPWMRVGSGPTKLSGNGVLVFAVNDNYYPDNTGSYRVTVSYTCYPGWGHGDINHDHCGPPGLDPNACYPGHGSGDSSHDHCGPPGQASANASSATNGNSEGNRGKGRP